MGENYYLEKSRILYISLLDLAKVRCEGWWRCRARRAALASSGSRGPSRRSCATLRHSDSSDERVVASAGREQCALLPRVRSARTARGTHGCMMMVTAASLSCMDDALYDTNTPARATEHPALGHSATQPGSLARGAT